MADEKISQLPSGGNVQTNDAFVAARAGGNVKILGSKILRRDVHETPTGVVNGTNLIFTVAHTPLANTLNLYLNGIFQTETSDYTLVAATITFVAAPQTSDTVSSTYQY